MTEPISLGLVRRGFTGRIHALQTEGCETSLNHSELENRLIEMGFIEGARVEIVHEGAIGNDPIAVRVDGATMAIRRREAMAIIVI